MTNNDAGRRTDYDFDSIMQDLAKESDNEITRIGSFNQVIFENVGSGKSTLVNAVFGEKLAETGIGAPVTATLEPYGRPDGILRIFDSRGFETGQSGEEIMRQLEQLIAERRRLPVSEHLHVAWYTVRYWDRRFENGQADVVRGLAALGLPVVLVMTQVPLSEGQPTAGARELARYIESLDLPLSCGGRVFFTNALEDEDTGTPKHGLSELVEATFQVAPEAARSAFAAAQRVDLELKRKSSRKAIQWAVLKAATIGAAPIPFSDAPFLASNQVVMVAKITVCYGLNSRDQKLMTAISGFLAAAMASSAGISVAGNLLKLLPGAGTVVGGFINGATASALTAAVGEAWIRVCERLLESPPEAMIEFLESEEMQLLFRHWIQHFLRRRMSS